MSIYSQTDDYDDGSVADTLSLSTSSDTWRRKRNDKYYFEDGTAIFWVGDLEFRVHKYFFARDSRRIGRLLEESHGAPVTLRNTTAIDFERFLSILYPINFERQNTHTTTEWASILTFADTWGFKSIRERAIEELDEMATVVDKVVYGKRFGVLRWLENAYLEVCERAVPLTEAEGERMEARDIVRIASVRERFLKQPKCTREARKMIIHEVFQLPANVEPTGQLKTTSDDELLLPGTPDSFLDKQLSPSDASHRRMGYTNSSNSENKIHAPWPPHSPLTTVQHIDKDGHSQQTSVIFSDLSRHSLGDYNAQSPVKLVDIGSPEFVDQNVRALLNELTMEKFDSLSDKIINWANRSEKEKDGKTLFRVIRLVLEKAINDRIRSEMYARLCRKMMEQISPRVQDEGSEDVEGKPIAGGQLFRKYLLNQCQEDFERGWSVRESAATQKAAASGESALNSDRYYAAQKAKRQGLGLVKFIGELFKLSMLTERIMHECIKKLLGNVENPEEDDIELLYELLKTIGPQLDTPKARNYMDVYFSRIRDVTKPNTKVGSRIQTLLLELIELRGRKWVPQNEVAAPATMRQFLESNPKNVLKRNSTVSHVSSRRDHGRGENSQVDPNDWTAGFGPNRVGDLSNFGKITKSNAMSFGSNNIFAGDKKGNAKNSSQSFSRQSNISLFSACTQYVNSLEPDATKPTEPPQRRKLNLLPRTKALDDKPLATASEPPSEEEDNAAPTSMSEADAKKKIEEDVKEFFAIRNLEEAEAYFTALPAEHHFRLIDKLVTVAVERKIDDAQLVADLFEHITNKNLCSESAIEEGLTPTVEILSDIAIDVPKAFELMAIMVKGTPLVSDKEKKIKLVSKCMDDSDKLMALLS